ncbi:MAG: hypothetical protein ABIN80_31265 [Dyadobacter sp.]|uniref:hypothetical protein n=1 Tax=Dyadobacter sp. TaxID=1914288 RepID=UPI003265CB5D
MKTIRIWIVTLSLVSIFSACSPTETEQMINEPAGSARYFIDNQSDKELIVEFPVPVYNFEKDAMQDVDSLIRLNSRTKSVVFEDGGFGINPDPEKSFKEIRFYTITNGQRSLAFTMKPIKNAAWAKLIRSRDNSGYGLTEYSFTITEANLK